MQIPTDPTDAAALDTALQPGQRRNFAHLLEVDWNRDGLFTHAQSDLSAAVTSCQVTRIRADSTVGAAAVASGAAAAQLTAVLEGSVLVGGVWVPVTELLAPYNFTSPLYRVRVAGTPIRWTILTSTSRGWIGTQQMLGTIDQRGAQRSTNRVTLICLDAVVQLQRPAWWPPYAVDGPSAALAGDDSPQRGLASSVVDQLCNANGLRTRPRPPWQSTTTGVLALVWLPLCGSFAPAAGRVYSIAPWGASGFFPELYNQSPAAAASYWITGQWGLARDAAAGRYPGSLIYTCRDTQPTYTGRSTSITAWILCGPNSGTYDPNPSATLRQPVAQVHMGFVISSNYYALRLGLATNGVTLQIQVEVGTTLIYRANYVPGTDAWRHVQVQLDHSAGPVRAKLIVDGVVQQNFVPTGSTNTEAAPILNVLFLPAVGVRLQPGVRMSDVMAWQEIGAPVAVPERTVFGGIGAVIDPSLNEITYLPAPTGTAWDVIKDVSASEYAAVTVNEQGVLLWRNRLTARSAGPTAFTLDLTAATDVGTTEVSDGTANAAQVTTQAGAGTWATVFSPASVDQIPAPAGLSVWIVPVGPDVLVPETGTEPRLFQTAATASTAPIWSASVISGWVFVYDTTQIEELTNQSLVDTTDQTGLGDQQLLRIVVNDTGGLSGRFRLRQDPTVGTDPQPALRIAGMILALAQPQTTLVTSPNNITADGRVNLIDLGSGPWRQQIDNQAAAARFVLRRATQNIPVFDNIVTPGDPRRQISDPCLITLGPIAARVVGYVAGITRTLDDTGGLSDELTIRATHAPGAWALGDPVLGRLGSTAVLG